MALDGFAPATGSNLEVTDGTDSVTAVEKIDFTGSSNFDWDVQSWGDGVLVHPPKPHMEIIAENDHYGVSAGGTVTAWSSSRGYGSEIFPMVTFAGGEPPQSVTFVRNSSPASGEVGAYKQYNPSTGEWSVAISNNTASQIDFHYVIYETRPVH